MATQCSFDITSNVDLQEVDNALNQARKEVAQRYDFKGAKASIDFDPKESKLVLAADDEFKVNALWEIVSDAAGPPERAGQEPDARHRARRPPTAPSARKSRCSRASPPRRRRTSSSS